MSISKELINRLSDEVINQEVLRIVDLKRQEISLIAKVEVDKYLSKKVLESKIAKIVTTKASGVEKWINSEIKSYFDGFDMCEFIEEYFSTDEGQKILDNMVKEILAKGIKV